MNIINKRSGLVLCWMYCAVCLDAFSADRFSYSLDGAEVFDGNTGLIWRRCAEGKVWSGGTCTGRATAYTHDAALRHAQTQMGWRLPNVKELTSLLDDSGKYSGLDTAAFPNTPSEYFWSSSPYAADPIFVWSFNYYYYAATPYDRGVDRSYFDSLVRLVR